MDTTKQTGTWTCGICGKRQPATVGGNVKEALDNARFYDADAYTAEQLPRHNPEMEADLAGAVHRKTERRGNPLTLKGPFTLVRDGKQLGGRWDSYQDALREAHRMLPDAISYVSIHDEGTNHPVAAKTLWRHEGRRGNPDGGQGMNKYARQYERLYSRTRRAMGGVFDWPTLKASIPGRAEELRRLWNLAYGEGHAGFPAERERVEAARAEREESRRWAPQTEREARIEAQERASAEAGWRQDRGMGTVGGAEIFDE